MKKILVLFLASSILLSASPVFAFWGWGKGLALGFDVDKAIERLKEMFENWAKILGISVEKVKEYWAQGIGPKEIMEKEGINEEKVKENIRNLRLERLREFLQKLVDKGIITKEQMEKRLKVEEQWMENCQKCKFFHGWFGKRGWKW